MAKDSQAKKHRVSVLDQDTEQMKKTKRLVNEAKEVQIKKRKVADDGLPIKVKKSRTPSTKQSTKTEANYDVENSTSTTESAPVERAMNRSGGSFSSVEESETDDQTEVLLNRLQCDGDDENISSKDGLPPGKVIPTRQELSKDQEKILERIAKSGTEKPGVVYVGRIPHGFYEHEMRGYFKQFGAILNLRLSRNKKTGASKHHAWIQFESATVAGIVAKTMDNYLMFGHLLKVKLISDEQIPAALFKGANRRFKQVPWNRMAGRKLEQAIPEEAWEKRISREEARRVTKAKVSRALGYEFESPKIKSIKDIPKKPKAYAKVESQVEPLNEQKEDENVAAELGTVTNSGAKVNSRKKNKKQEKA